MRAAVEYMRGQCGVTDVTLAGLCSGAYHALRGAIAELPVNRILLVNPLNFLWGDGTDKDEVQPWEIVQKPGAYLSRVWSAESWRRVLSGDVSIVRIAKIYLSRPMFALQARLRNVARRLRIPLKNDLGGELENLRARGVRITFVFARGDAGINLLAMQSGLSVKELRDQYRLRTIDGADHDFTRSKPRADLESVLSEELYARPDGARAAGTSLGESLERLGSGICSVTPPPKPPSTV